MMKRMVGILAVLVTLGATAGTANALKACAHTGNGTLHCYEIGSLQYVHPRALVYSTQLQASMKAGFATAEGWASWPAVGGQFGDWIEAGLMVWPFGEKGDLRPHTFYATEHAGAFYAVVRPGPASSATPPRYYFAISDEGSDGCYVVHDLLSPEGYYYTYYSWKGTLARYCGRPGAIEYSFAGGELETEEQTLVSGHSEVALSEEENGQREVGAWLNWPEWATGYTFANPEVIASRGEGGPGSVVWRTATPPAAPAAAKGAAIATAETAGGMTVQTGTNLAARLKLTAPNGHKPTGTYRATMRNGAGQITAEYIGNAYPDEAKVASGGAG